ncbi:hypothetical protein [Streptosporangium sp. NPDC002607]
MDDRAEIQQLLASRRARITPEQAGLPAYGGTRWVKGLRREEIAMPAGVSVDHYVRLERGNLSGASDGVLDGVVRALHLDDDHTTSKSAIIAMSSCSRLWQCVMYRPR